VVLDFSEGAEEAWEVVNDVVMGGVSTSDFRVESGGVAVFEGTVSLKHGGGFASVRSRPARLDLSAYTGLEVRVRGDGKRYRFRLRTDPELRGVAYQATFDTDADVWQTIRFPFKRFRPTFRGRRVPEAPPLDARSITSFGWLIAERQAGPFRLEIDWVRSYGEGGS
jgi:monofunctional biosynthetic peptidoglycan transglycosylase